jgi:aromatic-L-amino-acid decarboxylase
VPLNLVCFRYRPAGSFSEDELNWLNEQLLHRLNNSGKMLLTQTKLDGRYTLRLVAGQEATTLEEVRRGWELIKATARATVE